MHASPLPCVPTLELERSLLEEGHRFIAGVDEVGRGSWAGPVVAAAVVLPLDTPHLLSGLDGVRDSKQLSPQRRQELCASIIQLSASVAVGWSSHHVIDRLGIATANRLAMERAVAWLRLRPDALLLDYFRLPACSLPQLAVPKGDARSLSIAAASIVAKVVRDRWMEKCDARFPGYGFAQHKGYGTPQHREALRARGPSPLHRRSFQPLLDWEQ